MHTFTLQTQGRQQVLIHEGQAIGWLRSTKWYSSNAVAELPDGRQFELNHQGFWRQRFQVRSITEVVAELPFSLKKPFKWPAAGGGDLSLMITQRGFWRMQYELRQGDQVLASFHRAKGARWWQSVLGIDTTEALALAAEPHLLLLCAAKVFIAYQQAAAAAA